MALSEVWKIGRDAHPSIAIPANTFVTELPLLLPALELTPANDLKAHAADVYLAVGCLLGVRSALAILERDFLTQVPRFVARIDRRPEFADDVTQLLRERLLTAPSKKLGDYAASGPLLAWLRIVSRRLAIDVQRREGVQDRHLTHGESAWELVAGGTDPEWEALRRRYRAPLEVAIKNAVAALSTRDRMVLRLYLLGGANIEKIGKTYGVHRATVARWIVAAQGRIVAAVRAELGSRLGLSESECDSIVRDLRSRLTVSLNSVL